MGQEARDEAKAEGVVVSKRVRSEVSISANEDRDLLDQGAVAGSDEVVKLLVEEGLRLDAPGL